jgi:hypothetical protein
VRRRHGANGEQGRCEHDPKDNTAISDRAIRRIRDLAEVFTGDDQPGVDIASRRPVAYEPMLLASYPAWILPAFKNLGRGVF